ncbi:MAG: hypothetical protein ACYCP1_05030 [Thermoplasmataceae archaeon]
MYSMKIVARCRKCHEPFVVDTGDSDIVRVDLLSEEKTICPKCRNNQNIFEKRKKF